MRTLLTLCCVLVCACGGDDGDPWETGVDEFVAAACLELEACSPDAGFP